ncbi:MAG: iron-containing alcohol dehydrogenase [Alphaproteobacteria bacterium]|nr:iron-containing alcohol dehydrogenase [Alphaproteobacteria bacterium]
MALITYLTRIQFDFGAVKLAADELKLLGVQRPLVVTDRGIVRAGLLAKLVEALGRSGETTTFQDTPENPTEAASRAAVAVYRAANCDGIVAIGGGSSLDLAKAVRLLATHDGPLSGYAMVNGGVARIRRDVAPLMAIPTTAGTGSEVGRGAVMITEDGRKLGVVSPFLIPNVAICDPELTLGLPAGLTAGTGLDAIAHCVETFLSPSVNPPADAIALDGLARAWHHVERAVRDGHDREARWQMMMAAMEGAMAFQKGLGAIHALSHPLGALAGLKLHHGTLNAVVMPAVLRFNKPAIAEKSARLAAAMGLPAAGDATETVAAAVASLNARLGLPRGLGAMGVPAGALAEIASAATADHCHATNPRAASAGDYVKMLEAAY